MASLRSRLNTSTLKNCGNILRRSISTQGANKSFVVPAIASSVAVLAAGGTAVYAYNQMKNNVGILPVLQASAVSIFQNFAFNVSLNFSSCQTFSLLDSIFCSIYIILMKMNKSLV